MKTSSRISLFSVVALTGAALLAVVFAAASSDEAAAILLTFAKMMLATFALLFLAAAIAYGFDARKRGEVVYDEELFEKVRPVYWRAARDEVFHGVLDDIQLERALAYFALHEKDITNWLDLAVGPEPPINEEVKEKPLMWEPENWVWFLQKIGKSEWKVNQKTVIQEALEEEPQPKKEEKVDETGVIEFEHDLKDSIERWEEKMHKKYTT